MTVSKDGDNKENTEGESKEPEVGVNVGEGHGDGNYNEEKLNDEEEVAGSRDDGNAVIGVDVSDLADDSQDKKGEDDGVKGETLSLPPLDTKTQEHPFTGNDHFSPLTDDNNENEEERFSTISSSPEHAAPSPQHRSQQRLPQPPLPPLQQQLLLGQNHPRKLKHVPPQVPKGIQHAVAQSGAYSGVIQSPSGGYYPYSLASGSSASSESMNTPIVGNVIQQRVHQQQEKQMIWKQREGMSAPLPPHTQSKSSSSSSSHKEHQKSTEAKAGMVPVEESKEEISERTRADVATNVSEHGISVYKQPERHHGAGIIDQLQQYQEATITNLEDNLLKIRNLFIRIEQERHMHELSSLYFGALHRWCMFLPAMGLAFASGLMAFIFQANIFSSNVDADKAQVYASIAVGFTALFSVLWQWLSYQLRYGARADMHAATATLLGRLREDILLTLQLASSTSANQIIPPSDGYVAEIFERFHQALSVCSSKSAVPFRLRAAFVCLSDRMTVYWNHRTAQQRHTTELDFINVYGLAYDELTLEIVNYWAWPFRFPPDPRWTSVIVVQNLASIVTKGHERDRNCFSATGCLGRFCNYFGCCSFKPLSLTPGHDDIEDEDLLMVDQNSAAIEQSSPQKRSKTDSTNNDGSNHKVFMIETQC